MKPFQRFNLIYGMNGSGKTTLSRFFADLNEGKAAGFPDLKYKIRTEDGDFVQGKPYTRKIRVFNAEYVEDNLGEIEGTLNPIFVLGAENKALADTVKTDEKKLVLWKISSLKRRPNSARRKKVEERNLLTSPRKFLMRPKGQQFEHTLREMPKVRTTKLLF